MLADTRGVPFEPLNVSPEEEQQYRDTVLQLLDRTLRSYDEREESSRHHANLESTRWKQLKTQWNASLYAERTAGAWRDIEHPGDTWDDARVLLVAGTIDGTLDDVMLGLETPDFTAMQMRSEIINKQPVDGAILAQMAGPTDRDPFQFMGIMWMVGEQGWPLSIVVRPRDFITLSATGVIQRANGERIGYEVATPLDLPECPELPKPMVRAKTMRSAIYKECPNGTVDVYIQLYVEAYGRLMDKVVVNAMWGAALGFFDAPQLAELKKLQWCIDNRSAKGPSSASSGIHCESCSKKQSLLSRRSSVVEQNTCAVCAAQICSDCKVRRTLKVPSKRTGKLDNVGVVVCHSCMVFVRQQQPAEIALDNQRRRDEMDEEDSHRATSTAWEPTASSLLSSKLSISLSDFDKLVAPFSTSITSLRSSTAKKTKPQ